MGVKLAHALGAQTVAFTTSENKRADAKALGADQVVVSRNSLEMDEHLGSFDMILNTVAASHDLDAYSRLLKRDGVLVLVGVPEHGHPSPSVYNLVSRRRHRRLDDRRHHRDPGDARLLRRARHRRRH
jgi:uncharacterized zinc-type alcohol dehydrogenase-like protein